MMKTMMALGLVLAGGCVTDELGDDDAVLGEEVAALSGVATHALTASTYQTKDLGAASRGTQCFLATVEGDISAGIAQFAGAGAGVYVDAGRWVLYARPSSGSVRAEAVCVTGVNASSTYAWTNGQPSTEMESSITDWRCFLTEVTTARTEFASGGLHTTGDVVQITQSAQKWRLGGATTGLVSAKARCIEINQDSGVYSVWANAGATANSSTVITGAATACALQRLDGHFDAEGTGVDMTRAAGPTSGSYYWLLGATNASGGAMRCVQ